MPKMTIYIRDGDLDLWLAMDNKSEAISQLLNGGTPHVPVRIKDIKPRTKGEILEDISAVEADRDERLAFCQDKNEANTITKEATGALSELWEEYHALGSQ